MNNAVQPDVHLGRRLPPGPPATGRRERHGDKDWVVYERILPASAEVVWRCLTEPAELARWVGTWRRVDDDGTGQFHFTFEGEGVLPLTFRLESMERGRSMRLAIVDPGAVDAWHLVVEIDPEVTGGSRLTARQVIDNAALAPSIAAGSEFYLDRLGALLRGEDLEVLDYDAYFVQQADHYRQLFPLQRTASGSSDS